LAFAEGEQARICCRRNHPWFNAYSAQLLRAWRGNIDIQFMADPAGTAEYATRAAFYASQDTKPERAPWTGA